MQYSYQYFALGHLSTVLEIRSGKEPVGVNPLLSSPMVCTHYVVPQ